jgi:hypothetical protein
MGDRIYWLHVRQMSGQCARWFGSCMQALRPAAPIGQKGNPGRGARLAAVVCALGNSLRIETTDASLIDTYVGDSSLTS